MAFTEFEKKRYEKIVSNFIEKQRPRVELRDQVDLSFRIKDQSVCIFELRPCFLDKTEVNEIEIAKTTYVRNSNNWKIYWMRSDLKWHAYEPLPKVKTIERFLEAVEVDQHGCFWG